MINLIPQNAQKQVTREYWVRVISVWMFLFGSGFLIVALLNAPVYVLVRSQLKSYQNEFAQASDETDSYNAAEKTITQANNISALLGRSVAQAQFSDVISQLEAIKGPDISIETFDMTRKNGAIDSIVITGVAASRVALSSFKDTLQHTDAFKSADLPLSNLAKDRDIPFSITIGAKK